MKNFFFMNELDNFLTDLRDTAIQYTKANRDKKWSDNQKFQQGLMDVLDKKLDDNTVEYLSQLQLNKVHIRERVLYKYLKERLPSMTKKKDEVQHFIKTRAQSKKNQKLETKIVEFETSTPGAIEFFPETKLDYMLKQNPFELVHHFRGHDLGDIKVLSVSNGYKIISSDKNYNNTLFITRIKRSYREAEKKTDWVLGLRSSEKAYDSTGVMTLVNTPVLAYKEKKVVTSAGTRNDRKDGMNYYFHSLPDTWDKKLVAEAERIAEIRLTDYLRRKERGENIELERDDKKIPGITVKRTYLGVPAEFQIYTHKWHGLYERFHDNIITPQRVGVRFEKSKKYGVDMVAEYLDSKFRDIFTLKV